ncbi:TetR family transcriptional regulator [Streptomonospora nanhaiensis]|uniref:TetR family transcriptional regulator n=1 Tax=Streptomonospora nanhaiensis TaxID=1323731 RepID=UPI001C37EAE3|nr:TetR family transcriptional regulator [Streptomonospora nanhaiensis]MBV2367204.1 TetR family transcriptional regulator [Streptomonospora nanhaiensis]
MPRASASAAAQTARQVLASATDLFAAQGFAAVSLDDVARAAGVTRGAVYHHYANKTGLFRAVAAHLQADVAAAVVRAAERAEPDPRARLRAGSHAFLDAITAAPAVRVLLVDAPAVIGWAQWRALDAEHSAAHLRDALAEAGVDGSLLDALTAQLSGAMNEAALWLAERADDAAARESAHRALDRLLEAVAPRPA